MSRPHEAKPYAPDELFAVLGGTFDEHSEKETNPLFDGDTPAQWDNIDPARMWATHELLLMMLLKGRFIPGGDDGCDCANCNAARPWHQVIDSLAGELQIEHGPLIIRVEVQEPEEPTSNPVERYNALLKKRGGLN